MTAWIVISFSRLLCMRPEIQRMKHCTSFFLVWCGLHFIVDVWHHRILSPVVYSQINLCKVNIIAGIGSAHLKWAYRLEPLYGCNMDVSRCPLNCWFFTEIVLPGYATNELEQPQQRWREWENKTGSRFNKQN